MKKRANCNSDSKFLDVSVFVVGWFGAQRKHLRSYENVYHQLGINVRSILVPMQIVLDSGFRDVYLSGYSSLFDEIFDIILKQPISTKYFFHFFSNAGAFAYEYLILTLYSSNLKTLYDPILLERIRNSILGVILDSSPVHMNENAVRRTLSKAIPYPILPSLLYHFWLALKRNRGEGGIQTFSLHPTTFIHNFPISSQLRDHFLRLYQTFDEQTFSSMNKSNERKKHSKSPSSPSSSSPPTTTSSSNFHSLSSFLSSTSVTSPSSSSSPISSSPSSTSSSFTTTSSSSSISRNAQFLSRLSLDPSPYPQLFLFSSNDDIAHPQFIQQFISFRRHFKQHQHQYQQKQKQQQKENPLQSSIPEELNISFQSTSPSYSSIQNENNWISTFLSFKPSQLNTYHHHHPHVPTSSSSASSSYSVSSSSSRLRSHFQTTVSHDIFSCQWEDTPHVDHLRDDPVLYASLVQCFISYCIDRKNIEDSNGHPSTSTPPFSSSSSSSQLVLRSRL